MTALTGFLMIVLIVTTAIIATIAHLDGTTATTVLITIPALYPVYKAMNIDSKILLCLTGACMGVMDLLPWGGPVARAATVLAMDANELWHLLIPIQIIGLFFNIGLAVLLGMLAIRQGAGAGRGEVVETDQKTQDEEAALRRPKLLFFNLALTIVLIAVLSVGYITSYVAFLLALSLALAVNYPSLKLQDKLIKKHAPAALMISATLFAAGAMVGVFDGTGMLTDMANAIMQIIPGFLGRFIHIIFGILALPLGLCIGTDAYFYGIMPLVMEVGETYGVASLSTALAMVIGKNLALMVSPLTPATYLAIGLTKPFRLSVLTQKVKALIRRSSVYNQQRQNLISVGPFRFDLMKLECQKNGQPLNFTARELVEMEQQQLLTMAETVGQSLVSYVSQELESMDLYFSALEQEEMKEQDAPDKTPAADTWNERGTKQYHAAPPDNKENDSRQTEVPDKLPFRGTAGVNSAGAIYAVEYFLRQNTDLYDAMVCFDSGGQSICRSGTMDFSPGQMGADLSGLLAADDSGSADSHNPGAVPADNFGTVDSYHSGTSGSHDRAVICGKSLCAGGWYQMFISRRFSLGGHSYQAVYAMNLNKIYARIVEPVRIGSGGYSIVKDSDLAIIMHHAADQIGMDAVYDRSLRYPDLDLKDLTEWIARQAAEGEGVGVIRSYIWGSPDPQPERRIVAYTTIHLPGEDWIVNSTLPYRELDDPLRRMLLRLAGIGGLSLGAMACFIFGITRSLMRTESQKKEIEYLKEINAGMELLRRREEELQHYQRVQSIGQMSSHIAHEFNNYLTPVFVYGELLVALEADPALPSGPEALPEMPEKGWVLLSVADTGCGISKDVLDKIFEPFYTTKRSGKGTGLGLSVVQNVMTAVGGQIRIHSVPGDITVHVMIIRLPCSPGSSSRRISATPS